MTDFANRIFLMRVKSVCHLHFWFLIKPFHQPWSILCNHHHHPIVTTMDIPPRPSLTYYPSKSAPSSSLISSHLEGKLSSVTYNLLTYLRTFSCCLQPPKDIQCQCQTTTKVLWMTNSYPVVWKDIQWLWIRWDALPCFLLNNLVMSSSSSSSFLHHIAVDILTVAALPCPHHPFFSAWLGCPRVVLLRRKEEFKKS